MKIGKLSVYVQTCLQYGHTKEKTKVQRRYTTITRRQGKAKSKLEHYRLIQKFDADVPRKYLITVNLLFRAANSGKYKKVD